METPIELTEEQVKALILDCKIKDKYRGMDLMREVAKRPEIRLKYSCSKSSGSPLFEGSVMTWNSVQLRLIYWCSFYNNIEGAYERPPDRVVQNNKLLDKWLESKAQEASAKYESDWSKGSGKVQKTAYDQNEIWELS